MADFTPTLTGYSGQNKFRYWCQKVLPLVYDDSLSYYELLGKVVDYLNNTIADVSACEDNITALRDAFVQLQDYVNEMFDDFAPEIERIIDEMIDSGEFGEILAGVINEVIASEYSTTKGYAQFDYVIKDGKLYCATASTSGEWDDTKWRETTVGADMQLLNQRVYNLNAGQVAFNDNATYGNGTTGKKLQELNDSLISTNGSWLAGKKVSIIGDSIDTFNQEGYKVSGYATYYPSGDVADVNDTWWMRFINASGASLEVNASYAGSYVTNYDNTMPDFYARTGSNILGNPDVILVALGLNDNNHGVAIGNFDYTTPYQSLSESEFRPAYIKGIKALQANFPDATIICVIKKMLYSYYDAIMQIAMQLNCLCIDVRNYETPTGNAHPNSNGMRDIAAIITDASSKMLIPFLTKNIEPYEGRTERNYPLYDYIIHNNKLYRVISQISNNAPLDDTNVVETTILEELRTKLPMNIDKEICIKLCRIQGKNNLNLQFTSLTASGQKATVFILGTVQTNDPIVAIIGLRPTFSPIVVNLNANRTATPTWSDDTHTLNIAFQASGYDNFIVFSTIPFTQIAST